MLGHTPIISSSAESCHFFELRWDDCFRFSKDIDQFSSSLSILSREVCIGGSFQSSALSMK